MMCCQNMLIETCSSPHHTGVDEEDVVAYGEEDHLVYHEEAEEGDEFER